MAKRAGRDLYLEVKVASVWTRLGPSRADAGTLTNEVVDDSSKTGDNWRTALTGCGTQAVALTSSGIIVDGDAVLAALHTAFMFGTFVEARLVSDGGTDTLYETNYKVASFERGGEYNGAEEYSAVLESAGTVETEVFVEAVRYTLNAGGYANLTEHVVDFNNLYYDPENLVTTGVNWEFETPGAAVFEVAVYILHATTTWTGLQWCRIWLEKDIGAGWVKHSVLDEHIQEDSEGQYLMVRGGDHVSLPKNGKLRVVIERNGPAGTLNFHTQNEWSSIQIAQVLE